MVATDTSSLVNFLAGRETTGAILVEQALINRTLLLPPPVLAEVLSSPRRGETASSELLSLGVLPIVEGYWERAGRSRRRILAEGLKARTIDALIAQTCIDAAIDLITDDNDFRHFETYCGLTIRR